MKKYTVEQLLVPLSEYATVPVGSTLYDAVLALEKAQEEFDQARYRHRGILVMDSRDRVIGKLNHLDALQALDPYPESDVEGVLAYYGFSRDYVRRVSKKRRMEAAPLENLRQKAITLKVEDIMQHAAEDECIDCDASLDLAIHQLTQEKLRSLLVVKNDNIIGILRLADVFAAVYHTSAGFAAGEGRS